MKDFEVLVVDDASRDRSAYEQVIARFAGAFSLRYLRNDENRGAQYSRNRGVAESKGELIAFVDDDDEWLPRKLELQARVFGSAPEQVGLVYAWADAVAEDGTTVHRYRASHSGNVVRELIDSCFIPSPTVVVRRAALQKAGTFDESLPSCQDWDMWTRLVHAGYEIDVAKEVLALHHKHPGPSIGSSPRSIDGYGSYYAKHATIYAEMRMEKNLSEKHRALAHRAMWSGNSNAARRALRRSISLWPLNWKAWVRYGQCVLLPGREAGRRVNQ